MSESAKSSSSSWSSRAGLLAGSVVIAFTLARQLYLDRGFPDGIGYYTPAMKIAEQSSVKAKGKTYLVSGANAGLGLETARVLYSQGSTVIVACRTLSKAQSAVDHIIAHTDGPSSGALFPAALELSDLESVRSFAQLISDRFESLDALICNAGIMGLPQYQTTKQGFESQFGVNQVGHWYLARLLTPLLQKTPDSRLLTLSTCVMFKFAPDLEDWISRMETSTSKKDCSGPSKNDYAPLQNYAFSKACNVLFAHEYHRRYSKTRVSAISLSPGVVFTPLSRHESTLKRSMRAVLSPLLMKTVESGAGCTVYCTLMDHFRMDGCLWSDCKQAQDSLPAQIIKDESRLAKRLWDVTEQMIQDRGFPLSLD